MHDSFMPLGGFVQIFMIQFGEVIYGGVGSGLYGMLVFVILAMFIAGLMVGCTPELYGKKIEPDEMKISTILILIPIFLILILTAAAVLTDPDRPAVFNPGAMGFRKSCTLSRLQQETMGVPLEACQQYSLFYNLTTAFAMVVGRYATCHPHARTRGLVCSKEDRTCGRRHIKGPSTALHPVACLCCSDCRSAEFPPCTLPWTCC